MIHLDSHVDSHLESHADIHEIVHLAWSDDVSFSDIEKQSGMTEKDVIKLMRNYLKPKSFKVWRQRVYGRKAKHPKRYLLDHSQSHSLEPIYSIR